MVQKSIDCIIHHLHLLILMLASTGESKPTTLLTPYTFIGSDPAIFEQSLSNP